MNHLEFSNGDRMPIIGLGTWKARPGEVHKAVKEALRLGYSHIDCAPIYGNEAEIGQALRESFAEDRANREQVWLTSKLWNNAHAPADVKSALLKTLSDLGTDYLDLFLIHWPVAFRREVRFHKSAADLVSLEKIPIAETWGAMEELVDEGLCRHIGVSNFSTGKLESLLSRSRHQPEMNQIELHPYLQQPHMLEFCTANKILLTAYAPLGSSDRPVALKSKNEPVLLDDPVIAGIAAKHGATPAQILLGWAIQRKTAVIPKSTKPNRLKENLAAADLRLTEEDRRQIAALDRQHRYVSGSFWVLEGGPYTLSNLWDE